MMLQAFLLTALVWTNTVEVWHVVALAVVLGAAQAVDAPARQSFVVELVDDRADLTNAIGLNSTVFNAGRAIGPAVAGIAVATTGEGGAFLINGFTFLAVIGGLMMMRLPQAVNKARASGLAHMREGVRFLTRSQDVLVLMSIVGVSAFLSMPYSTLLPVFAKDVLAASARPVVDLMCGGAGLLASCQSPDAVTYGFLMAAGGVGAVTGALFVASLPPKARRGRWLTAGNLAFPALLIGVALSQSFWVTELLLVGIGFSFVAQNALVNTLIQFAVPDEVRGRVMSVYSLSFQGMMRLGGMQAGFVGEALGAPLSVGIGAAVSLLFGVAVAVRFPRVREMK
jgi:MFS family permease